jgi:hypothetical protein
MEFLCLEDSLLHISAALPSYLPSVDIRDIDLIEDVQTRWSQAAGLLYATLHNTLGAVPRWFEVDRDVGHPIARDSVRTEGMDALSYCATWERRERHIRLRQMRPQLEADLPVALCRPASPYEPLAPGKWRAEQTMRVLAIGFDKENLFAFLDEHQIAHVKRFPTPLEIARRQSAAVPSHTTLESRDRNARSVHLAAGEIAFLFAGIKWDQDHWMANLQSPAKWLEEHRHSRGIRGNAHVQSRWYPLGIAKAVVSRAKHDECERIRMAFTRVFSAQTLLERDRRAWSEHLFDMYG